MGAICKPAGRRRKGGVDAAPTWPFNGGVGAETGRAGIFRPITAVGSIPFIQLASNASFDVLFQA
jgi:hypothetical protein